eukprot:Opistho-1_new@59225
MSIEVIRACKSSTNCSAYSLSLSQKLMAALRPTDRPATPLLLSLFERAVTRTCPLAASSVVHVVSQSADVLYREAARAHTHTAALVPLAMELSVTTHDVRATLAGGAPFDIAADGSAFSRAAAAVPSSPWAASKFLAESASPSATGASSLYGRLFYELRSFPPHGASVAVTLSDSIPWQLRPYLHTLQVHMTTGDAPPVRLSSADYALRFEPSIERGRPCVLELHIASLPMAPTVVVVTLEYEVAMLRVAEHPPDAHRGFDLGSATVTFEVKSSGPCDTASAVSATIWDALRHAHMPTCALRVRLHTESPLLTPPTPDFSMPYNVLCLTCTVLALSFGSFFNLATRQFVRDREPEPLKSRIKARIGRVFRRGNTGERPAADAADARGDALDSTKKNTSGAKSG